MATSANPLQILSWPGMTGANQPPANGLQVPTIPGLNPGAPGSPNSVGNLGVDTPGGQGFGGSTVLGRQLNNQRGQQANLLSPQWAQLMGQAGTGAGNFFGQLMNLGSPYYQQQQQQQFSQGVQQNQNAAAQSRDQLSAAGYGNTPSGATAAMLGGEAVGGSGNLALNFLQNLFQNEQMQLAGAQGLGSIASLFNPTGLLTGQTQSEGYQPPGFAQQFGQITGGLGALAPKG